ncbi:hypothetical protein GOBAR_AA33815 [Gossypium barbadense]|uniref:G protein gamma domain-containing protein n=1 Tax=Gossypium barbadense TaxID=3634 RepID=A0A2P5W6Z6_GOSBA|nr:hypothetical protein GOBAR_AA33815 [Gossypium barbadense]
MAAGSGGSLSLPPPCPKSPPEYPDLYRKRRETAKVQMLEREISFLEVELKSVGGLQHASRCCKEVTDFVTTNSDPLIPTRGCNKLYTFACCPFKAEIERTGNHVAFGSGFLLFEIYLFEILLRIEHNPISDFRCRLMQLQFMFKLLHESATAVLLLS